MSRASVFGDDDLPRKPSSDERRRRAEEARKLAQAAPDGFQERQVKKVEDEPSEVPPAKPKAKKEPKPKKRKPGRPKGTGNKIPTAQFNFHLRSDLKAALDAVIEETMGGAYKSAYMTRLVKQHLVDLGAIDEG